MLDLLQKKLLVHNQEVILLFTKDFTTSNYDNQTVYFSKSLDRFFSFKNDILFYSKDKMLLTDAIRTSNKNTDDLFVNPLFLNCYNTTSSSAEINLMINYNNLITLSNIFINTPFELNYFSEWTATDVILKNNRIIASGFS